MNSACIALVLSVMPAGNEAAAFSDQAQKLAERKQFGEAEKLWKSAIAADAKYFPALFNLGYFYYSQDATPKLSHARTGSGDNRQDFNSRYLLGASLSRLNRTDAALRAWRAAQPLKPEQAKLLSLMVVEYGKGRYFNEAADTARQALKLSPSDEKTYYLAIKALDDAGNSSEAQEVAKSAVDRFPQSARANFEFGFHLSKSGNTDEAAKFLRRAMELDPKYEEPPYFLGEFCSIWGKLTSRFHCCENRSSIAPIMYLRACCYLGAHETRAVGRGHHGIAAHDSNGSDTPATPFVVVADSVPER